MECRNDIKDEISWNQSNRNINFNTDPISDLHMNILYLLSPLVLFFKTEETTKKREMDLFYNLLHRDDFKNARSSISNVFSRAEIWHCGLFLCMPSLMGIAFGSNNRPSHYRNYLQYRTLIYTWGNRPKHIHVTSRHMCLLHSSFIMKSVLYFLQISGKGKFVLQSYTRK